MHFGIRSQRGSLPHALGLRRWSAPWGVLRHVPRAGLWFALAVVGIPAAHGQTSLDTLARPTGALRSGDLLNIRVYRDSELTGKYLIDAQGDVQIPGLGVIRAAGLAPADVRQRLVDALRDRGFRAPEIAVWPQIRVSVLGEVRAPALYSVEPGASLIEVITMAGGPTERANLRHTKVVRDGQAYTLNFQEALAGSAVGRMALYSNDVVYVPAKAGVFSRENLSLIASLLTVALAAVTLIQVTKH
jgi:protein involved in polysaccharide export with SLBB domain